MSIKQELPIPNYKQKLTITNLLNQTISYKQWLFPQTGNVGNIGTSPKQPTVYEWSDKRNCIAVVAVTVSVCIKYE